MSTRPEEDHDGRGPTPGLSPAELELERALRTLGAAATPSREDLAYAMGVAAGRRTGRAWQGAAGCLTLALIASVFVRPAGVVTRVDQQREPVLVEREGSKDADTIPVDAVAALGAHGDSSVGRESAVAVAASYIKQRDALLRGRGTGGEEEPGGGWVPGPIDAVRSRSTPAQTDLQLLLQAFRSGGVS